MRATLRDGTVVSGAPEHVVTAVAIDDRMHDDKKAWIARLRDHGVKAAHPDDGWVDRERNRVHLCYSDFNDGLQVGDLLALGAPWRDTRIVRIVGSSDNRLAVGIEPRPWYWHFEAVDSLLTTSRGGASGSLAPEPDRPSAPKDRP